MGQDGGMADDEPWRLIPRPARGLIRMLVGEVKVVGSCPEGGVLLCSNHPSYRDVFLFGLVLQGFHTGPGNADPMRASLWASYLWPVRWGIFSLAASHGASGEPSGSGRLRLKPWPLPAPVSCACPQK